MRSVKLLLLFLFFISSFSMAKNQLFYYEPKVVELTGIVKLVTFSGAPNYLNTEGGDIGETNRYLVLKKPIDIDLAPGTTEAMSNYELQTNVRIICLTIDTDNDRDWKKIRNNAYVRVKGTLFSPFIGNHFHTSVVLMIEKVDVLHGKKMLVDDIALTEEDDEFLRGNDEG